MLDSTYSYSLSSTDDYGPTSKYLTQGQLGASEGHHATAKEHTQV